MINLGIRHERLLEIQEIHINNLKQKIYNRINNQKSTYIVDSRYLELLDYFEKNVEVILGGDRSNLKKIIKHIEENFFMTDKKLNSIMSKRKSLNKGYTKEQKKDFLRQFSGEYGIVNYIHDDNVYNSVNKFEFSVGELKKQGEEWKKRVKLIFDYDDFTQDYTGWGAYKLVSELSIEVCPYCNRQFINTFEKNDKRAKATLDHFYAKSIYPYLALSMYNLIPSCYFCNSSLKGDEDFYIDEAIYPYEEQFSDNAQFITESDDYLYLLGLSNDFDIKIEIRKDINLKCKKKIERSIEVFALNDIYKFHKDYVCDLIRNAFINDESRINEIYSMYSEIFNSKEEVLQAVFLNYFSEDNLGKRVLAKLTRDICRQLEIFI